MAPIPQEYDFIVIGGGSGGSGAARRASGWYGAKTLLIENGRSGGTCVNVGCVPKKITWNFASVSEMLKDGVHYGYDIPQGIKFNFADFKKKRDDDVKRLNAAYERNWSRENIDLVHGTAIFKSTNEVEVTEKDGGSALYSAPHILIATGGYPVLPKGIPGAEHGISSDGFFDIEELPKKMAFVGAGYIAVELAGVMAAIGVEVHMFIRGETFLRNFDPMVQHTLTQRYEDAGIVIHKNHKGFKEVVNLKDGKPGEKSLKLIGEDGTELEVNELLWAIGRNPEIEQLDPAKVGVGLKPKGHIKVDEYQNTSVKGIYALGDVTGQAELTPVAIAAGRALSNRLFGVKHPKGGEHLANAKLDYSNIPTVVFAHPTVGTIGITEPQAIDHYGKDNVKVYHTRFTSMFYDFHPAEEKKLSPTEYKLVCEGPDERIVGMHILGPGSDEIMQGFGVAVKMGAKKRDFDSCVAIHPTNAEELVTLK
ncbi:MAG: Glutathione reductase [Ramalina farinacea]|uniref:Glutathione reductase n=1 Tax=Ramalina farinacea TaxID=258253 RepID=A0AA43QQK9_9LECA|nr:Glutathione reductase [Ramalina farinacea]